MNFMLEFDGKEIKITGGPCDHVTMLNTMTSVIEKVIKDIRETGDDAQAEEVKNLVANAVLEME